MVMLKYSPYDAEAVKPFRKKLHALGAEIRLILEAHQIPKREAMTLKTVGNKLAKSKLIESAKGDGIIEKITNGIEPTTHERLTGHGDRYKELNLENKTLIIGMMSDVEEFDPRAMIDGSPQSELFKTRMAVECEALELITEAIRPIFRELAVAEDNFLAKMDLFREFENYEIGHFYAWQRIDDPFDEVANREATPQEGLELN